MLSRDFIWSKERWERCFLKNWLFTRPDLLVSLSLSEESPHRSLCLMDPDILEGIKLITAKYSADICGFWNMDLTDFYDPECFSLVSSSVFGIKKEKDGQWGDEELCYLMTLYP